MRTAKKRLNNLINRWAPQERLIRKAKEDLMNAKSEYLFLNGIEGTITGVEKTVGQSVEDKVKQNSSKKR